MTATCWKDSFTGETIDVGDGNHFKVIDIQVGGPDSYIAESEIWRRISDGKYFELIWCESGEVYIREVKPRLIRDCWDKVKGV